VQVPVVQVSGKVVLTPGAKNASVMAFPLGQQTSVRADGTFAFWGLAPGKYTLVPRLGYVGSTPLDIEVTTTNLENLELRIPAPFNIAGEVRFDDEQARAPTKPPAKPEETGPPPAPRRIELRSIQKFVSNSAMATVAADDSFALQKVQPGLYRVSISWESGYVKSVRLGDTESAGNILDVLNGSAGPLALTVSSNFCEVSGAVNDSNGPLADVKVALAPIIGRWSNTRVERTDSNGNYKFTKVVPGKYKLFAVDQDIVYPEVLEDYDDIAESLDLSPGDKISKDLRKRK
jgi:hypothetical protein